MRKNLKLKRRCCPVCYPHKRGYCSRWKDKEREQMVRIEKQLRKQAYDEM